MSKYKSKDPVNPNKENVFPTNYDEVAPQETTVKEIIDSKSERKNSKRGETYQGNPSDPYVNTLNNSTEDLKMKPAEEKSEDLNKRSRPEPTSDLEGTSNREDG